MPVSIQNINIKRLELYLLGFLFGRKRKPTEKYSVLRIYMIPLLELMH